MFSTPSVRFHTTNENIDNVVQRKLGDSINLARKPFIDRSVNSKTPDTNRSAKDKLNIRKDNGSLKKSPLTASCTTIPKHTPRIEDLDATDFIYSGNDNFDNDFDIIDTEKICNVLHCYYQKEDIHPSLTQSEEIDPIMDVDSIMDIDPMFFALPEHFNCEESGMVEMPRYEHDDLVLTMRTL